jgi:hypothetical protein
MEILPEDLQLLPKIKKSTAPKEKASILKDYLWNTGLITAC